MLTKSELTGWLQPSQLQLGQLWYLFPQVTADGLVFSRWRPFVQTHPPISLSAGNHFPKSPLLIKVPLNRPGPSASPLSRSQMSGPRSIQFWSTQTLLQLRPNPYTRSINPLVHRLSIHNAWIPRPENTTALDHMLLPSTRPALQCVRSFLHDLKPNEIHLAWQRLKLFLFCGGNTAAGW